MSGLNVNWFLLLGLSGCLSILVSAGLVVPTTVEMQTTLYPALEDSAKVSPGVAGAGGLYHGRTISGTKPTEHLQPSGSSPDLVTKINSSPVPIQNPSSPPGFGTGRTSSPESSDPTSDSRRLISRPPESPEPSKSSMQSTLVPARSQKTHIKTSSTSISDLYSLISTPQPQESEGRSGGNSTPIPIQNHSRPPSYRTTSTGTFTSLDLSDSRRHISTPEPPEPQRSSSFPDSSAVPIQSQSSPTGFETTGRTVAELTSQDLSTTRGLISVSAASTTRKSLNLATTQILAATPPPCTTSKAPPIAEDQSCSPRGVVKPCLITIACLATLATVFMVSTIVLCAKLSTRKYKLRKAQDEKEMMFMSHVLLPERNYAGIRQRSPVSNGVLVIHGAGDSEEDISDNLTLSSFLPESDRFV
ncbi:P-selectin glycoprotein ligand 1 [Phyllopteryx taeniolatus]|uniref:P-selectin glycoprotein ligand 1 n=1 Tax=Phyllopteryx taeniolatus TaxID=161469 RepID=UPI002AD21718|nr:P-selectin glycoprotein ligand 1 [Phyllopteryx taeniolatus]